MKPKIGTCISFNDANIIEQQLRTLKESGYDNCQLVCWVPALWTQENARLIRETVAELGITISAFWCGWEGPAVWDFYDGPLTLGLIPVEYRQRRIENLCAGADFAKLLGITDVVTHMGFIPDNPNDPQFGAFCAAVRVVAQHCQKNGQYLLFETGQETPVTMLRCFEEVGCDNLGVNLDSANLILYGCANPVDALDVFGRFVRGVHAKDGRYPTSGRKLGVETPLGEGKVDFPALIRGLHELGYEGYITMEREITGEQQRLDLEKGRKFLQAIIDEVYAD